MKGRKVAVAIFYDDKKNIVVQKRGNLSKNGGEYGFWGGEIGKGETATRAIRRELYEELGYIPNKINYWTEHSFTINRGAYKGWLIELIVFLSPISKKLLSAKFQEGEDIVKLGIDEAISDDNFSYGDIQLLKKLKIYLG